MTPVFRSSSSETNRTWKKTGQCHGPGPSPSRRHGAMRPITKQARAAAPTSTRRLWISAGRLSAKTWLRRKCASWRRGPGEGGAMSVDGDIEDGNRKRSHDVIYCEGETREKGVVCPGQRQAGRATKFTYPSFYRGRCEQLEQGRNTYSSCLFKSRQGFHHRRRHHYNNNFQTLFIVRTGATLPCNHRQDAQNNPTPLPISLSPSLPISSSPNPLTLTLTKKKKIYQKGL